MLDVISSHSLRKENSNIEKTSLKKYALFFGREKYVTKEKTHSGV